MRKIILDLKPLNTPESVQEYLAMKFDFPEYYGGNLDALYDCLTDIGEHTCVGIFLPDEEKEISSYLRRLKLVFRDAEEDNPRLAVIYGDMESNFPDEYYY